MKQVARIAVVLTVVLVVVVSTTATVQPVTEAPVAASDGTDFIMNGPVDEASPVDTPMSDETPAVAGGSTDFILGGLIDEASPVDASEDETALPVEPTAGADTPPVGSETPHLVF
jgi:hypothetical protein